jgi:hypothetical protein
MSCVGRACMARGGQWLLRRFVYWRERVKSARVGHVHTGGLQGLCIVQSKDQPHLPSLSGEYLREIQAVQEWKSGTVMVALWDGHEGLQYGNHHHEGGVRFRSRHRGWYLLALYATGLASSPSTASSLGVTVVPWWVATSTCVVRRSPKQTIQVSAMPEMWRIVLARVT